jgi:hypothetical protein
MFPFDFTISGSLAAAFIVAALLPPSLFLIVRLPFIAGRNALQFLISVIAVVIAWTGALLFIPAARPHDISDVVLGAMVVGTAVMFFLEVWALLSRGYTLGLLITIYRSGRPLPAAELAGSYRWGAGLEWIMRHRLAGLEVAGLVYRSDDAIALTPRRGWAVASVCRMAIALLGLEATG